MWIASQCSLIMNQRWAEKPFPALYAMVAQLFLGSPYRAGTLEGEPFERCRFTTEGYDCVTLVESAIALARSAPLRECSYSKFLRQLEFIRYRQGNLDGYLSRLHYTSDWLADNASKHILHDISKELGGIAIRTTLDFMSTHRELYPALRDSSALIQTLREIERRLSRRRRYVIPLERLSTAIGKLQSGDIIVIATTKPGLDYAHIGIALRSGGKLSLIHASSKTGTVTIEPNAEAYIRSYPSVRGISVARPHPPVYQSP